MPFWEHFHHSPWFPLKTVCRNSSSNEQKPIYKKRKNENLKQMIRCKRIPTPTNPQSNPSPPPLVSYTIVAVLFKLWSTWSVKPSSWKLCKLGVGPYLIPEIGDTHPHPLSPTTVSYLACRSCISIYISKVKLRIFNGGLQDIGHVCTQKIYVGKS